MKEHMLTFLAEYQEMRLAQKSFFKTKNSSPLVATKHLVRAKQLELNLDKKAITLIADLTN